MKSTLKLILLILRHHKTYAAVAAAVASGIGMILSKNYDQGLETIFQALTVLFSGATAAGLHAGSAKPDRP